VGFSPPHAARSQANNLTRYRRLIVLWTDAERRAHSTILVTQATDWPYSSFNRYVEMGLLPHDWAGSDDASGSFGE
jgi:hypothetical protein